MYPHIFILFFILNLVIMYNSADDDQFKEKVEITVPKTQTKCRRKQEHNGSNPYQIVPKDDRIDIAIQQSINDDNLSNNNIKSSEFHRRAYIALKNEPPGIINDTITWKRDLYYEEIMYYLSTLSRRSNDKRKAEVELLGKSHQGREIKLVKIIHPNAKRIVFFDAGIHAREWLAIQTTMFLIHILLAHDYGHLVNTVNWYIVPLVNPDGYVQSHKSIDHIYRYHRKNMNSTACSGCKSCGVDLNRNFGYKWGVNVDDGNDPCSITYPGQHAFSEKESQILRDTLKKYHKDIILYVAMHSAGSKVLYPWGYDKKACDDAPDLIAAAKYATDIINSAGSVTPQWVYQIAGQQNAGGGGADDYAKGALGIKFCYTIEVQRGSRVAGFVYERKDIQKYIWETWHGIRALVDYVSNKFRPKTYPKLQARSASSYIFTSAIIKINCIIYLYSFLQKINKFIC